MPKTKNVRVMFKQALSEWWDEPSGRNWQKLVLPLYDLVLNTASQFAAKYGLHINFHIDIEDLAHDTISRFLTDFNSENLPNEPKQPNNRKPLTKMHLYEMRLHFTPNEVANFLTKRAVLHFKTNLKSINRSDDRNASLSFTNDEGEIETLDINDEQTVMAKEWSDAVQVTYEEKKFVNDHLEKIWKSLPKQNQLKAFLTQKALLYADVMSKLGMPQHVFQELNECEKLENTRTVKKSSRKETSVDAISKDAIQATILGRFLNLPRNTALERVKAFERYLENPIKRECELHNLDFVAVAACLFHDAIARIWKD